MALQMTLNIRLMQLKIGQFNKVMLPR